MTPEVAQSIETLRRAGYVFASPVAMRWLTCGEIAHALSMHPRTIRALVASGDLAPAIRWGAEIRVSERALGAWLARHAITPVGAPECPQMPSTPSLSPVEHHQRPRAGARRQIQEAA